MDAVRAGRRWVPLLNLRGSSSVAGTQRRSGAWLLWDAGARAQHVLGSGKDLVPNGSCLLSPQQPPPIPIEGGRLFIWNNANGVIRVSVSEIKSVTPFCRLIISTSRLQGDSRTLEGRAVFSQG